MVTPTRHNARAACAVVLAMATITSSDALVKGLLEEIKPAQFIFVRALMILLILGGVIAIIAGGWLTAQKTRGRPSPS